MFARISSRDNDKAGKAPAVKKNGHDTLAPQQVVPLDEDLDEELSSRLSPVHTDLKMHLHQRLLDMINLSVIDKMPPEVFGVKISLTTRVPCSMRGADSFQWETSIFVLRSFAGSYFFGSR